MGIQIDKRIEEMKQDRLDEMVEYAVHHLGRDVDTQEMCSFIEKLELLNIESEMMIETLRIKATSPRMEFDENEAKEIGADFDSIMARFS